MREITEFPEHAPIVHDHKDDNLMHLAWLEVKKEPNGEQTHPYVHVHPNESDLSRWPQRTRPLCAKGRHGLLVVNRGQSREPCRKCLKLLEADPIREAAYTLVANVGEITKWYHDKERKLSVRVARNLVTK